MSQPFVYQGVASNLTPYVLSAPSGGNQITRIITKITMFTERDLTTDDTINTVQVGGYNVARFITNDNPFFTIVLDNQFLIQRHNSSDSLAIYSTATPSPAEQTYVTVSGVEVTHNQDNDVQYTVEYFDKTGGASSTTTHTSNSRRTIWKQIVIDSNSAFTVPYYLSTAQRPTLPLYGRFDLSSNIVSIEDARIVTDHESANQLNIFPDNNATYKAVMFGTTIKI
jgi:hypothetical protein